METIKIKNSKLELVKLDFSKSNTSISLPFDLKDELRYQRVFMINNTNLSLVHSKKLVKVNSIKNIQSYVDEIWTIKKNKKKFPDDITYSYNEKRSLYKMISVLSSYKELSMELLEDLCRATNDSNLINLFYNCFGTNGLKQIGLYARVEINNGFSNFNYVTDNNIGKDIYTMRRKYDFIQLITELKESKSEILVDPKLIGSYSRISRSLLDKNSVTIKDKWSKLLGITWNKERANISLEYLAHVDVAIPKNDLGIKEEVKNLETIKSLCLVKDGSLWTKFIGIKCNDSKLIGKLKRFGMIKCNLIDNEFKLDLTKIPIISKTRISRFNTEKFSELEIKEKEYSIISSYLERLKYLKDRKLTVLPKKLEKSVKSDEEIFLNSLGIYGNMYYPSDLIDNSKDFYTAEVIKKKIVGYPSTITTSLENFINKGKCSNKAILNLLTTAKADLDSSGLSLEDYIDKHEKLSKNLSKELKINRFIMIMSKTLLLNRRDLESCKMKSSNGIEINWSTDYESVKV